MRKTRGFSLIELTVTFVVVGILSAIAVSYFRGASTDVQDSLAKRTLESAAALQLTYHESRGAFAETQAEFGALGGNDISFTTDPSTSATEVSVAVLGPEVLGLSVLGADSRCSTLEVGVSGPGEDIEVRDVPSPAACTGSLAGS